MVRPMRCQQCQTQMTVSPTTGRPYCASCVDVENTLADSNIPTTLAPQQPVTPNLGHSSTVIVPQEDLARGSALKNGTVLGNYTIVGQIGRGGMGCVYKAEQLSPRRMVALKVLLHGHSSNDADRLRFKREAAVVALLDHPNIVPIIESGETDSGELYYTMPLVEGVPLDAYVKEHRLPLRDILRLFSRVCAGVHAAHQRGAIHRDLKPGNILVNQAGRPQVLDFGLAKLIAEPDAGIATVLERSASSISDASIEVSRADEFLGTPAYMAPEQATRNPQDMDTRTDVYALGVILYRLLTGVYPYQFSGTIREIINTIREAPPINPVTFNAAIPRDLSAILLKALAKEKTHRFQSVAEFAGDIDAFLADRPVTAHATSTIYRTRKFMQRNSGASLLASLATIALVGVITATFFDIMAARDELPNGKPRPDNSLQIVDLTTGAVTQASYPPAEADKRRQSIKGLALSPDGAHLATASTDGSVRLWSVADGSPGAILTHSTDSGINAILFTADGDIVAGTQTGELLLWQRDQPTRPTPLNASLAIELEVIRSLVWSPDGNYLAIASGGGEVTVVDATFASTEAQFSASGSVSALCFLGDAYLVTGGRDGRAHVWDWRQGRSIRDFQLHGNMIDNMAMAGDSLLTAGWDKRLHTLQLSQPQRLASLLESVHDAQARLRTNPRDGNALKVLAWWQMEHGVWSAASDLFGQAQANAAMVPALIRARVHWQAGELADALVWLRRAHEAGDIPDWYFALCSSSLNNR